ncbi:uncharacterized protein LOC129584407 [Paramacrobiotus metropolitanus]|uniref:uncharacterized protein LOC129584407 n=1 Tax=Paramacrobiotus metropolitanus TaxID=2943436 RepID=UPI002445A1C7|nr:uncharacterized protein LOC129584407 [Paramacrobiotus metropolitanus]
MEYVIALTLSAYLLFATPVTADLCADLQATYDRVRPDEFVSYLRPNDSSSLWPVSAADVQKYKTAGNNYCTRHSEIGVSMKSLYKKCPDVYNRMKRTSGGWFTAEWFTTMGRLCETQVDPVKFIRAGDHCQKKEMGTYFACCYMGVTDDTNKDTSESIAHQQICSRLSDTVKNIDGPRGVRMVSQCGQDAVQTLKDAYQQLRTVTCKN